MKKILLLLLIIILYIILSKTIFIKENKKIKIKLKEEIAILILNDNVLVKGNNSDDLLLLKNNNKGLSNIKINKLGVILLKDTPISFNYSNKYLLTGSNTINGINYRVNNNIIDIKYDDRTFCIFNNVGSVINDTRECNFIYLYNINNIDNLEIDQNVEVVFIDDGTNVPDYLLEDIYGKNIDVYMLNKEEITVIKISKEDYNMFIIKNK